VDEVKRIADASGVDYFRAYNLIHASIDPHLGIRHGLAENFPAAAEVIGRDYEWRGDPPTFQKRQT
jgi:hypothetical protein